MTTTSPPPGVSGTNSKPIFGRDEVDLRQLAHALWRYRLAVVLTGLLGALIGLAMAFASTRFLSSGLFLTPGLDIASYKQYEVALDNEPRLDEFLSLSSLEGEPATLLRALVKKPGAMAQAVRPAFSITAGDAKSYGIAINEVKSGDLLGIRLTMERAEKRDAAPVLALAEYLRSTIILVDLRDTLLDQCLTFQLKDQELRTEQLKSEFKLTQMQSKADSLRQLIADTPGAASIDNRQVVSLENGADRFLSPTSQLVANEVAMSDLRLSDTERARERVAAQLKKDYYCGGRAAQTQPITGQALLIKLASVQEDVFREQDGTKDVVEQAANELDLERQGWSDRYLERMRFVVSPDGAEHRVRTPSMRVGLLLGGVIGGLIGVLLALMLAWWHDNRDEVLASEDA